MNCKECDAVVSCAVHGGNKIDEYEDSYDMPFYSCGGCVEEGSGLGSIVHWCADAFGMIGGKEQRGKNGDGRKTFKQKVFVIPEG